MSATHEHGLTKQEAAAAGRTAASHCASFCAAPVFGSEHVTLSFCVPLPQLDEQAAAGALVHAHSRILQVCVALGRDLA